MPVTRFQRGFSRHLGVVDAQCLQRRQQLGLSRPVYGRDLGPRTPATATPRTLPILALDPWTPAKGRAFTPPAWSPEIPSRISNLSRPSGLSPRALGLMIRALVGPPAARADAGFWMVARPALALDAAAVECVLLED